MEQIRALGPPRVRLASSPALQAFLIQICETFHRFQQSLQSADALLVPRSIRACYLLVPTVSRTCSNLTRGSTVGDGPVGKHEAIVHRCAFPARHQLATNFVAASTPALLVPSFSSFTHIDHFLRIPHSVPPATAAAATGLPWPVAPPSSMRSFRPPSRRSRRCRSSSPARSTSRRWPAHRPRSRTSTPCRSLRRCVFSAGHPPLPAGALFYFQ